MDKIKGKTIQLRLASPDDASFIYSLRIDEKLNEHISKVTGTELQQREWLKKYKNREKNGEEFYFIIELLDSELSIGTVRLYDFLGRKSFCWGSWILNNNKTRTAAIESAYLVYQYAFEHIGFDSAYFQVDKKNKTVVSFHEKTGAVFCGEDDINNNYEFTRTCYEKFKLKFNRLINGK